MQPSVSPLVAGTQAPLVTLFQGPSAPISERPRIESFVEILPPPALPLVLFSEEPYAIFPDKQFVPISEQPSPSLSEESSRPILSESLKLLEGPSVPFPQGRLTLLSEAASLYEQPSNPPPLVNRPLAIAPFSPTFNL
jgi:hypothetical protein